MALKKLRISFDLDMELLAKILTHSNSGMKIDVFGDQPKPPKLLAPPREGNRTPARILILQHLAKVDGCKPADLRDVCVAQGHAATTHSPQLHGLLATGHVKRKDGIYSLTAAGKALVNGQG
jgi:hypothetical protein